FWNIDICRMLVGVGEALFISLAAPSIDDNAPSTKRTFCLGLFCMCIPVGIVINYVYGGYVASHLNSRCAFLGEAIRILMFVILCFFMEPRPLKGFESSEATLTSVQTKLHEVKIIEVSEQGKDVVDENISVKAPIKRISRFWKDMFWNDMKVLLLEKVYVVSVLVAYSYWGPKAGADIYHMTNADMFFGGTTLICGVLGTLAGSYLLDRINSLIKNGFKLLTAIKILGGICCFAPFCFKNMYGFLAFFGLGQLFLFGAQAPVNFICLHIVKPSLRPISLVISIVVIHILGDVPSSPLVGYIQDHIHKWRATTLILTSIFDVAAAI
ncbi:hypothetical protein MKW92_022695, partial [Papaver armeniacum]